MVYTVKKLAQISGVSIRTLHWYDKIGLLKPAYHGTNGYRYYEEEQLLALQQILFFKELGFELKQIEAILKKSNFDRLAALCSHRRVLQKNVDRTNELIETIDNTISHLQGTKKMKDHELYLGFNKESQNEYQQYLVNRFGEKTKSSMQETVVNFQNLDEKGFEKSQIEWDQICQDLVKLWKNEFSVSSSEVQNVIQRHYEWVKGYWIPDRLTYPKLGEQYLGFEWKEAFKPYDPEHPKFAQFFAEGIKKFAENEFY